MEESALPKAIEGDYDALCNLLLFLSEAIRQRVPLTPGLADFLAGALRAIADGGDPKVAFHIRRKRGQRDTREAVFKAIRLAFEIAELRREQKRSTRKNLSVEAAIAQVANKEGIPEDTVRAAWRDYRETIEPTETPGIAFVDLSRKTAKRPKTKK